MGLTFIDGTVKGLHGETRTVKFLVDSGASYTLLPLDVWKELGLKPKRTVPLRIVKDCKNEPFERKS